MVPLQSIIIPEYVNLAKLGLINTYLGAILVYAALGTPFATFLMATYYRGISDELIEAAVMDGLGTADFLRIALPLSLPALATVAVLQFIQIWDDLLVGLLFLQNPSSGRSRSAWPRCRPGRTTSIPVLMAGSFISAVPAILVFLIFQRYLVRGLTLGMGKCERSQDRRNPGPARPQEPPWERAWPPPWEVVAEAGAELGERPVWDPAGCP